MISLLLLIAHLISLSTTSALHEFHLSKCDIDYRQETQVLEVSLSIYIDDLEEALRRRGLDSLKICTNKEKAGVDMIINTYIKEHFKVSVDDQDVSASYQWIGKEISEDLAAVWCYIEIPIPSPQRHINIEYDVLMEVFDDQKNVVKLNVNKSKKGFFLFSKGDTKGELTL